MKQPKKDVINKNKSRQSKDRSIKQMLIGLSVIAVISLSVLIYMLATANKKDPEKDLTIYYRPSTSVDQSVRIADNIFYADTSLGGMTAKAFSDAMQAVPAQSLMPDKLQFSEEKKVQVDNKNNQVEPDDPGVVTDDGTVKPVDDANTDKEPKKKEFIYYDVPTQDIGLRLNLEQVYKNALELTEFINKQPTKSLNDPKLLEAVQGIADYRDGKFFLKNVFTCDQFQVKEVLESLASRLNLEADDALIGTFDVTKLSFDIVEGKDGRKLKVDDMVRKTQKAVADDTMSEPIELEFKVVKSKRPAKDVSEKLGYVATGQTSFPYYEVNRNTNINRGADLLNGVVIQPGATLSFWDIVGPCTRENGYVDALTQTGGVAEPGIGGGLCHVSTTLFQALAKANLDIVEHHNHSLQPAYTVPGTDAMVSSGWADFKVFNPTEYPYAIVSEYNDLILAFHIYGPANPDNAQITLDVEYLGEVQPPSEDEEKKDDSLAPGEKKLIRDRVVGLKTRTYRVYSVDGVVIDRKPLVNSYYEAFPRLYKVGPPKQESDTSVTSEKTTTTETTTTSEETTTTTTTTTVTTTTTTTVAPTTPEPEQPDPEPEPEPEPDPDPEPTPDSETSNGDN